MAEMTVEQQRAIAIARARMRAAQAAGGAQPGGQQWGPEHGGQNPMAAGTPDPNYSRLTDFAQSPIGQFADSSVRALARGVPFLGAIADRADPRAEQDAAFALNHPVLNTALPIAGGVASLVPAMAAAPAAFGLTQATLPGRMGAGALSGTAIGAGDAAMRGANPLVGAAAGGVAGGAGPAIGQGIGHLFGQRAARRLARTPEENRAASNAAYSAARSSGLTVAPQAYNRFVREVLTTVRREGYDPGIQQNLGPAFDRIAQLSMQRGGISLDDLDHLRQIITAAANSNASNASQGRIAGIMRDALDDFVDNMPVNVGSGGADAIKALREARDLWNRTRKGELLVAIQEKARDAVGANYTNAGMQTALRQQFRRLADRWFDPKTKSRSELRFFTPEERQVVFTLVRGGTVQNALRWLGKFAPTSPLAMLITTGLGGQAGAMLGSGLGAGGQLAGAGLGGIASGALMSAALGARAGSQRLNMGNVRLLESLVSGGQPASQAYAQGTLTGPIVQRLMQATGVSNLPRLAAPPLNGLPPKP